MKTRTPSPLLFAILAAALTGCVYTPPVEQYHQTATTAILAPVNNVITVANNTPLTVRLSRDGIYVGTLMPGESLTVRLYSHIQGAQTTIVATSDQPPAMETRTFYLHSTGLQALPWQINHLRPRT